MAEYPQQSEVQLWYGVRIGASTRPSCPPNTWLTMDGWHACAVASAADLEGCVGPEGEKDDAGNDILEHEDTGYHWGSRVIMLFPSHDAAFVAANYLSDEGIEYQILPFCSNPRIMDTMPNPTREVPIPRDQQDPDLHQMRSKPPLEPKWCTCSRPQPTGAFYDGYESCDACKLLIESRPERGEA